MSLQPDLIIADKDGKTVALVEVKSSRQMNAHLAAEYFKRYRDSGALEGVRFFLLVSRKSISIWDQQAPRLNDDLANLEFTLPEFLARRAESSTDGYSMELAVLEWLYDFAANEEGHQDDVEVKLREAGILAAIQDGTVRQAQSG